MKYFAILLHTKIDNKNHRKNNKSTSNKEKDFDEHKISLSLISCYWFAIGFEVRGRAWELRHAPIRLLQILNDSEVCSIVLLLRAVISESLRQ